MIAPPIKQLLHEQALRIAQTTIALVLSSFTPAYLRVLAIEMYRISNGLSPTFMVEMMNELDILYHTRSRSILMEISQILKKTRQVYNGPRTSNLSQQQ